MVHQAPRAAPASRWYAELQRLLTLAVAPPERIDAFLAARALEIERLTAGEDDSAVADRLALWSRAARDDLLAFLGHRSAHWPERIRPRRIPVLDGHIELTGREFLVFQALARHRGQWLTRRQLLALAWPDESDLSENVVSVYVGYLRRKLGPAAIETLRGVGYRMP